MAQHDGEHDAAAGSELVTSTPREVSTGTAVIAPDALENPGLAPHRERATDLDPKTEKSMERRIVGLFALSIIGTIAAIVVYIVVPIEPGNLNSTRLNNLFLGIALAVALIPIGVGAILWAKNLMKSEEVVEERHATRGSDATREKAANIFAIANEESGFGRRKLLRNTLIGAVAVAPLPAVVLLRDLAPAEHPATLMKRTLWDEGVRLARDPDGTPIRAADVTIGSVFHVIPENLYEAPNVLEEKAKAVVLLMRLKPEDMQVSEGRENWNYNGIVAYSKICTHVGCPVALFEQHTHHLLCPCHQSQFDIGQEAKVIFGPAKRPLPQLPITVDSDGYLVAQSDFHEPVGPTFWERNEK